MTATINASTSSGVVVTSDTSGSLALQTASTTAMTIDTSQNVGLGVAPSAWNTSVFKALQINAQGALMATSASMQMGNNVFYDSVYKFIGTGYANRYYQASGQHVWTVSTASGTAGNAITETQAMTLDASSRLLVGTTTVGVGGNGNVALSLANGNASIYQSIRASGGEELYLYAASGSTGLYAYSNSPLTFGTNNTERARITSAGNLSFTTSNAGIIFNNSSALANSTLNDYETGTWTPTDVSGAGLSYTTNFARYTKIGNQVTVVCQVTFPSTANSSAAKVGGLPFVNGTPNQAGSTLSSNSSAQKNIVYDSFIYLFALNSTSSSINSALSGATIYMGATYLI